MTDQEEMIRRMLVEAQTLKNQHPDEPFANFLYVKLREAQLLCRDLRKGTRGYE